MNKFRTAFVLSTVDRLWPFLLAAITTLSFSTVVAAKPLKHNYCPNGEESIATKIKLSAETSQFYINICTSLSGDENSQYVGVSKTNRRNSIYAPLIKEKPDFFVGANGVYSYVVDAQMDNELRIFKGNRLILKQKLYNIKRY
jgi:hypothetical protein